ncbi:preprotein translocase subunit SecE [Actinocrinis sp.]|uniref:preprotein translocase subunit SecE n=1 Tax=Actinocrinis sp. TaxID=1920516 RepID=UPI002C936A1E|nr:preprotein translocase subunit SecE [Actinocrinis sp.]HXR69302.1 preprotein translocase subunit SecE [Actinocrinis sp.]
MSQTRSDAEDLDGASAQVEPRDAAPRKAAEKTDERGKKSRSERRAEKVKSRARAKSAAEKSAPRKKRATPALYYRQIVAELRKVVWPTRTELGTYTSVVIVFVLCIIGIIALFDFGLTHAVQAVFG